MSASTVLYDAPGPKARARYRLFGLLTVIGIVLLLAAVIWRLWSRDQLTADKWEVFYTPRYIELLARATLDTLWIAALSIAGALVFGVIFGVAKLSDHLPVRWFAWVIVEFFRAVPLLLLIIFVWFYAYDTRLGTIAPLVIALILYNGSVLAETFRAGINAVPKGQVEAAFAVGLRKSAVMRIVQLPQAIKIMTPAIISQCIVALKDTSLGYYILAAGLTTTGREIWRTFDNRLATALVLAAIYIVLNLLLTALGRWAERHITGARPPQALADKPGQPTAA
ncbi:hypothetical protein BHE97_14725 [Aeromicrobium sp. PE09-221]|uniref:amino acid ABC transporter permease n=1 Tax=Aeromicrobium sp. PE09-221 TaxID=1898043 RepID=UPI000B3E71A5|nr:amino acid ABC transporter permease [Aeromicrobium sp. PE09-221]OUZ07953.1 hypothetical protein BHE97_14725 [Aeromicrobium sp. PE09-221]